MGEYDIRDNWGRKVGTIRPSTDTGCTGLLMIILIPIILVGAIVWGIASYASQIVHPTIQDWVSYSAKDARISGSTGPGDVTGPNDGIQLNEGGSVEFDISVPSDDQYSVTISEDFHETYRESVIVNGKKVADLADTLDPVFTLLLNKGSNTIKVINNTSDKDTSTPDVDIHSISIKTT